MMTNDSSGEGPFFYANTCYTDKIKVIMLQLPRRWRLYSRSNSQKPPALCETQQVLVHIAGMRREFV